LRKLLGNRKAISPVLSTVLLILIVVTGMSVAFGYFVSFVKDYQTGRGGSVMELVSIEDVWFNPTGQRAIEIWLYNYGKVDVKMNAVYVNGAQLNFDPNPILIPVGKHNCTIAYPTNGWDYNTVYDLKLVTERGSAFEGEYASPSG
jgi:flagellin-like protein